MRKLIVIATAALACALPAVAPAHTAKFETKVKIKDFVIPEKQARGDLFGSFFGRVRSGRDQCVRKRKVKIFQKQSGDDALEGKGTSDTNGFFGVPVKLSGSGVFYAKVSKRVHGSGRHSHVCKGARSPNFVFEL
jgi:hypothetical protein